MAPKSSSRPEQRPSRSSAPASSPRPQPRDQAKAQAFLDSQGGDDNQAAAVAAQQPAVQQGIAAMLGGSGKRVFAQTPMFNAAGNVVGTYDGRQELPMTPFMIDETIGLPQNLLPPPRQAVPPQGLFGRELPSTPEMRFTGRQSTEDFMFRPTREQQPPFLGEFLPSEMTAPTVGTAPRVDTTSPPTGIPAPVEGMFISPSLPGMPVPQGGRFPVTRVPGMMDQPPSRSPLMSLRPQEMGVAPAVDMASAPRPTVPSPAPIPAPAPQPTVSTADRGSGLAGFGFLGIAKNLIDNLAGGRDSGPSATAPQMRPSVMNVLRGEGDDAQMEMVATRDMPRFGISAGDAMVAPEYSPFSLRGLTSTDPANVMRNIQGAERMARVSPMGGNEDQPAPAQPVAPPVDVNALPAERPSWWPSYLPWPPAPPTAAPMPTYTPPPTAPAMPGRQYSTSYSGLQGAISGAGNPLMMGIGGMIRRP